MHWLIWIKTIKSSLKESLSLNTRPILKHKSLAEIPQVFNIFLFKLTVYYLIFFTEVHVEYEKRLGESTAEEIHHLDFEESSLENG